jgi:tetratricopeptide (TPR) repeat protein
VLKDDFHARLQYTKKPNAYKGARPGNVVIIFSYAVAAVSILIFAFLGLIAVNYIRGNLGGAMAQAQIGQTPVDNRNNNTTSVRGSNTTQRQSQTQNIQATAPQRQKSVQGYINGSNVYIRPNPKRQGGKIFFQIDDVVNIYETKVVNGESWARVEGKGASGWVFASLISEKPVRSHASVTIPAVKTESNKPQKPENNQKKNTAAQTSASSENAKKASQKFVQEGTAYWKQGNWRKAYESFDKAYKLNPTQEIMTFRENALKNIRAEEQLALQRKQQEDEERERQLARQKQQELEDKRRREEAERIQSEKLAKEKQDEEALRLLLGIGAIIYNNK